MIEQGELADKISTRSSDLKKWLMSVNVLRVLEGVVELMKTVSAISIFHLLSTISQHNDGNFHHIFPNGL